MRQTTLRSHVVRTERGCDTGGTERTGWKMDDGVSSGLGRKTGPDGKLKAKGGEDEGEAAASGVMLKRRRVAAAPAEEADGVTEYERQRAENIRRNFEILVSLGIEAAKTEMEQTRGSGATPRVRKEAKPRLPVRRSARVQARGCGAAVVKDAAAVGVKEGGEEEEDDEDEEEEEEEKKEVVYDESSVVRYTCGWRSASGAGVARNEGGGGTSGSVEDAAAGAGRSGSVAGNGAAERKILGFQLGEENYVDSALTRIYTMDVLFSGEQQPVFLAAAGHQGRIAVFGSSVPVPGEDREEEISPLLSWKGGAGWMSHVQFLSTQPGDATLLLSSSNDRRVVLWDINKQQAALPRVMAETTELHDGGIFSMHEFQGQIATSSKDSSVSIAVLTAGTFEQKRSMSGFIHGPVKGIRFRDCNVLAACGSQGRICLLDLRDSEACVQTIESSHMTAVNVVEWNSWDSNLLLSASNDLKILIHDVRSPATPLHKLSGHVHPTLTRCKSIYRPAFCHYGKAVASPGERSDQISLYSASSGQPISRGHIGYNPSMVMSTCQESGCEQLWVAGRSVSPFFPLLSEP